MNMGNRNINVCFYSGHCEIVGGDAKYLFDVVGGLSPEAFTANICTDINPEFEKRASQWQNNSVPVEYLDTQPKLFVPRRWGRTLAYFFRVCSLQWLRDSWHNWHIFYPRFKAGRDNIDVFHFNNGGYPGKDAGLIAMLAAKKAGVKNVVMTVHSEPAKRSWRHPFHIVLDRLIAVYCQHTIIVSNVLRQELINFRGFDPEKVTTIYCGLDDIAALNSAEKSAKRTALGLPDGVQLILVAGSFEDPQKGHAELFRAFAIALRSFPQAVLLVAGEASPERQQVLASLAEELFISDNIRFLGYRTDIHALNCIADIAVVPSLYGEATPYTSKEAARAGTPIVTTSAGGCAEAVEQGVTGFIVTPYDVEALAEALSTLLADKELRRKMGQAGRELFLQRFLLLDCVRAHEKLYRELVGEAKV